MLVDGEKDKGNVKEEQSDGNKFGEVDEEAFGVNRIFDGEAALALAAADALRDPGQVSHAAAVHVGDGLAGRVVALLVVQLDKPLFHRLLFLLEKLVLLG